MASLVRPIKTLSEMANAFFSRAEWPLCSLSKVPPVQAKRFFFNSLNRLFFREKSGPAGISVALPLSFRKRKVRRHRAKEKHFFSLCAPLHEEEV